MVGVDIATIEVGVLLEEVPVTEGAGLIELGDVYKGIPPLPKMVALELRLGSEFVWYAGFESLLGTFESLVDGLGVELPAPMVLFTPTAPKELTAVPLGVELGRHEPVGIQITVVSTPSTSVSRPSDAKAMATSIHLMAWIDPRGTLIDDCRSSEESGLKGKQSKEAMSNEYAMPAIGINECTW
ncbi:hypothetical protein MMC24_004535 [Lignoscripta atroalba]|nr:hypothetical protein [Lignoscripta atroalba]